MKKYARILLFLIVLLHILLFISCGLAKEINKKKVNTDFTEQIKTITTRVGDTVYYEIPIIKPKDTTIYTYNRQGTRLAVQYDERGEIDLAECISSVYAEMREENRRYQIEQQEKEKTEKVDTNINWTWIILGLLAFIFLYLNKKT